ncbi:hypothetical protein CPC08DRAFT_708345 [Agrocybe pediades]|nr:hypothetical protein CPC08DRAFT_708345 [Agrocybe pediades]
MFADITSGNGPSVGGTILIETVSLLGFIFADGLLVWRCVHVCGRSLLKSSLPIGLFIAEIAFVILCTTYACLLDVNPGFATPKRIKINTRLGAVMFLTVAATSVVATFMICREIFTHTTPGSPSRKRYRHLVGVLIQSCLLYSVVVVIHAALALAETGEVQTSLDLQMAVYYLTAVSLVATGLAPTLMIAGLFMPSSQGDTEMICSDDLPISSNLDDSDIETQGSGCEIGSEDARTTSESFGT